MCVYGGFVFILSLRAILLEFKRKHRLGKNPSSHQKKIKKMSCLLDMANMDKK